MQFCIAIMFYIYRYIPMSDSRTGQSTIVVVHFLMLCYCTTVS
jgi:hypothetical protein